MVFDPFRQRAWASEHDAASGGAFTRRVRLLKRWNEVQGRPFASWHLEVVAGALFDSAGAEHARGLVRFFEAAADHLHVADPDGYGCDPGAGLSTTHQDHIRACLQ